MSTHSRQASARTRRVPPIPQAPVQAGHGNTRAIRVLIADGQAMTRLGLKGLLEADEGFEVVALAKDGAQVVEWVERHRPQVVTLDVRMARLNGIDATLKMGEIASGTAVLAITDQMDPISIQGMLRAGALGYIHKDTSAQIMLYAIRSIARGEAYFCPRIARRVVESFVLGKVNPGSSPLAVLTPREREVAQLLSEGYSTRHIAKRLFVSIKTVDTHRYQVLKKLGLRGIADLTRLALREGLSSLDT